MQPSPVPAPQNRPAEADVPRLIGNARAGGRRIPPVNDPAEALEFCRALAAAIDPLPDVEGRHLQLAHIAAMIGQAGESMPAPMLSIVIPVFNEEENLPALHARLSATLTEQKLDYEVVFVDDGSQDQSPAILRRLEAEDRRVVVVEFARNFGHQVAISAGLEHTRRRRETEDAATRSHNSRYRAASAGHPNCSARLRLSFPISRRSSSALAR